jgi:preprotein translocase subunit SecG|uniref:Preprotein translocase subunit G n=1 Tax=Thorea hispida TaxID=202687 RepID=A0A1C9CA94_9FLOR|nr:preprotein translocase subunit G [Thorea hispida]AOM65310.1 preprotein translocase subunit G [Thorea hispida]ARX95870.1 hypothetical protein [Thorea hispida]UNJ79155.1 preprotein translocase subunit G [Thorea hispida]
MKVLWYIFSFSSILCILLNNPKSKQTSQFNINIRIFQSKKKEISISILEIVTWLTVCVFLFVTILLTIYYFDIN